MCSIPRDPSELQKRLGYCFRVPSLLELALTHKSLVYEEIGAEGHNERLEFLGDAILGAVISAYLYEIYPNYDEGDLTKLKAVVVSQPVLADAARELDLGAFMRFGPGEATSGGPTRSSNLASCLEAIIAGVFLDGGFQTAYEFVTRLLAQKVEWLAQDAIKLDYKTALQERWQSHAAEAPHYEILATFGPAHARLFEVAVKLSGQKMGHGIGRSRKEAEQKAAHMAMQYLDSESTDKPLLNP